MKKEIMDLVNSEENGEFRINNISTLRRWTENTLGEKVDGLALYFDNINNVNFSLCDRKIISRDYDGIMREIEEITRNFMREVEETLIKNLKAGYRNAR